MDYTFGMIITSIWGSTRFRSLPGPVHRLAYLYFHTSEHRNSIGCYRLPAEYLVADMTDVDTIEQANDCIAANVEAGLVDYDQKESVIRIRKWFPYNPINSPKHLAGAVSKVRQLPSSSPLVGVAAADVAISAHAKMRELQRRGQSQVQTAKSEKARTSGHINLESAASMAEALVGLFDSLNPEQITAATAAFLEMPERQVSALNNDLNLGVFRAKNTGIDTPTDTPIHTHKTTETETETDTDTETETETETGKPPKKPVSRATADAINELNEKAGRQKK